jgi:hypothetical protein
VKNICFTNLDEIECETNSLSYYEEKRTNEHGEPKGYYQMSNGQLILETSKEQVELTQLQQQILL